MPSVVTNAPHPREMVTTGDGSGAVEWQLSVHKLH